MDTMKAARIARDVVVARGADAREYLQTQLTQDVVSLEVGQSAWSFLLEPKSEIVALLRVTRIEDDALVLDTDRGWGEAVRQRVDGFLFRTKVTFEASTWGGYAVRGPGALALTAHAPIEASVRWGPIDGVDLIGPDVEIPDGIEVVDEASYDSLRIWAGWPAMGSDIDAKATPAMTGLVERTVSFTKGCYTGQEFVARVHYREAAPPRRLVQLGFHPSAMVAAGDEIVLGGEPVGWVTSVAPCQPLGLGYVKRGVDIPGEATCSGRPLCFGESPASMNVDLARVRTPHFT
jgi:folate-binding protein YgfZ